MGGWRLFPRRVNLLDESKIFGIVGSIEGLSKLFCCCGIGVGCRGCCQKVGDSREPRDGGDFLLSKPRRDSAVNLERHEDE